MFPPSRSRYLRFATGYQVHLAILLFHAYFITILGKSVLLLRLSNLSSLSFATAMSKQSSLVFVGTGISSLSQLTLEALKRLVGFITQYVMQCRKVHKREKRQTPPKKKENQVDELWQLFKVEGYMTRMLPGISVGDSLLADHGIDPSFAGFLACEAGDFLIHDHLGLNTHWIYGIDSISR